MRISLMNYWNDFVSLLNLLMPGVVFTKVPKNITPVLHDIAVSKIQL